MILRDLQDEVGQIFIEMLVVASKARKRRADREGISH